MRDCSESDSEGGAGPARRTRSVAPAARRRQPAAGLSVSSAQLSISSSDLHGGGRTARAAPALCQRHRPPHVCQCRPCDALHLCRLYVDGFCPREDATCRWGHMVKSADNWRALAAYQLEALPERELLWLVRALLRQTAPVSVEEYRRQLALCAEYVANARCRRPDCFQLHLCRRLVAGECRDGAGCRWSHNLADADNVMVLLRLKCADLSEDEVLARLAQQTNGDYSSDDGDSQPAGTESDGQSVSTSTEGEGSISSVGRRPQQRAAAGLTDAANAAARGDPQQQTESQKVQASTGRTPDTSANDLSTEGLKQLAPSLDLCRYNIHPSSCPQNCQKLHLCRLYAAGMCPFENQCKSGHRLNKSPHNSNVLCKRGLQQLSEAELLEAIRTGYLSRNPITDLERQFALQICRPYQTGSCRGTNCTRLHICQKYVLGACENGRGCIQSHQLKSPGNTAIVRRVGLNFLSHGELLGVLSNPLAAKDVWLGPAPRRSSQSTGPGSDQGPDSAQRSTGPDSDQRPTGRLSDQRSTGPDSDQRPTGAAAGAEGGAGSSDNSSETGAAASSSTSLDRDNQQLTTADAARHGKPEDGPPGAIEARPGLDQQPTDCCGVSQSVEPLGSDRQTVEPTTGQLPQWSPAPARETVKTSTNVRTKEEMQRIARTLDVCREYGYPSKCLDKNCKKLHLCRFFVAEICTYAIHWCSRSHKLQGNDHNNRLLQEHQLLKLPEAEVFKALKAGYLARNPVTDLERRFLLQMCRPYQRGHCKMADICTRIHVCDGYVSRECEGSSTCGLSHNLKSPHNAEVVRDLELYLKAGDIREILEKPVTASAMWNSWAPKKQSTASTGGSNTAAAASAGELQKPNQAQPRRGVSPPDAPSSDTAEEVGSTSGGQLSDSAPHAADTSDARSLEPAKAAAAAHSGTETLDSAGVAAASDNAESLDSESLESDEDGLADDGPTLCAVHASGGRCQKTDCDGFHICGFFLANLCRRPDHSCPLGHSFGSAHNMRMMELHGLLGGSPDHFQELLDQVTLRARITFANEAEEKVTMCIPFNSPGGCTNADCCGRFHVCNRFLAGTCPKTDCDRNHGLTDEHNRRVRKVLGLAAAPGEGRCATWATDRDIVELIRSKLGVKPGVYKSPEVVKRDADETKPDAEEHAAGETKPAAEEAQSVAKATPEESGVVAEERDSAAQENIPAAGATKLTRVEAKLTDEKTKLDADTTKLSAKETVVDVEKTKPGTEGTTVVSNGSKPCSEATKPTTEIPKPAEVTPQAAEVTQQAVEVTPPAAGATRPTAGAGPAAESESASLPPACDWLGAGQRCPNARCAAIHICPHYLAGACRRQNCTLGHRLTTDRNQEALQLSGRTVTEKNRNSVLKEVYAASPHIPKPEVYQKLRICIRHNHSEGCKVGHCTFIHVCQRFVGGTCQREDCSLGHSLVTERNKKKLQSLGLQSASVDEVLEMLRAVHGVRSMYAQ